MDGRPCETLVLPSGHPKISVETLRDQSSTRRFTFELVKPSESKIDVIADVESSSAIVQSAFHRSSDREYSLHDFVYFLSEPHPDAS
jgi:hypothetical protein